MPRSVPSGMRWRSWKKRPFSIFTNSPSRRIDVTRLPFTSERSSRHRRSESGDIQSVIAAMNIVTASAASSTGFRSHHCFVPAALMTTSSEPWFIELNV